LIVIGNGQLGSAFKSEKMDDVLLLASGVSDSSCTNIDAFNRESSLVQHHLERNPNKKVVYFSSSALSAGDEYANTPYYVHKKQMENLIKSKTDQYYIFRIPQLFGCFISHKTIINHFYESILNGSSFKLYDDAYRYLIHIDDLKKLVLAYLKNSQPVCVDLANPYSYRVLEIVQAIEKALNKKANYDVIQKTDKYELDLSEMKTFIENNHLSLSFGVDYFECKLQSFLR
jgi:nucleoside-diphosphate-sugar epimerase